MEISVPIGRAAMSPTDQGGVKKMAMAIRQMLVPLGFSAYSPPTLDDAIRLADPHQVHMTLLHVMRAPTLAGVPPSGSGVVLSPLLAAQEVDLHHALETCAERVWDAGLACEAILTRGTPLQRITREEWRMRDAAG